MKGDQKGQGLAPSQKHHFYYICQTIHDFQWMHRKLWKLNSKYLIKYQTMNQYILWISDAESKKFHHVGC